MGSKYIITENQLDKFISKYIGGFFSGLQEIDSPRINAKHFVNQNNEVIFYYGTDSGNLYIKKPGLKEHLENHLENVFDLGWIRSKRILEDWFLENYGIEVHKIY
jgi:hypothetical protein